MPKAHNPAFKRCIGIDCSGAESAESGIKGLRVYQVDNAYSPAEVHPLKVRGRGTPEYPKYF